MTFNWVSPMLWSNWEVSKFSLTVKEKLGKIARAFNRDNNASKPNRGRGLKWASIFNMFRNLFLYEFVKRKFVFCVAISYSWPSMSLEDVFFAFLSSLLSMHKSDLWFSWIIYTLFYFWIINERKWNEPYPCQRM